MWSDDIELKRGDIFCTRNPMWLGRMINAVQTFWAADNHSEYSHAGIITDPDGTTFESLWTIRHNHIDKYEGAQVLIGRHMCINSAMFEHGWERIRGHQGQIYPFHRLLLHIIPPVAKYVATGRFPVCSELVCKFLWEITLVRTWAGKNPDHVADMIKLYRGFEVVYEGMWGDDAPAEVVLDDRFAISQA